jgi:hypothetical protein
VVDNSGGDSDLVSQVSVTGTEESAAKLDAYADSGAKAFEKLNTAAQGSAAGVKKASDEVSAAAAQSGAALNEVSKVQISKEAATRLRDIQSAAQSLTIEIKRGLKDITEFAAKVTTLAAAGVAAGAGILKLASGVAKAASSSSDALDKQAAATIAANNSQLAATTGAINYESAQRKLFQQLQSGAITNQQYSASLLQLKQDYNEQIRVAAKVEAAQEAVRLENERVQKTLADRKAYQALIDTWGGPMLTSLITLGNAVNTTFTDFKNAVGPGIAAGFDVITSAIEGNSGSINKFFNEAGQKVKAFVTNNAAAIKTAIENVSTILSAVFNGIIAALPILLDLFNNKLVPAIKSVGTFLDGVASVINRVFGTEFTGGVIAALLILTKLTGGFKLLNVGIQLAGTALELLVAIFGPWGILIAAVVVGLVALAAAVDWSKLLADATAAGNGIIAFFQALPGQIIGFFTGLWTSVQTTAAAAVQFVMDAWNGIVGFFQGLPAQIGEIFTTIGQSIQDAFNTAVENVKSFFQDLSDSVMGFLQPIIDALKAIIALGSDASTAGGTASPGFASGGSVMAKRGHVRGAGSSTSDSIAAWLSNNEFVMRAKAVQKYGTDFMHAINSGSLDPSQIMRFAAGGLVQRISLPSLGLSASGAGGASGRSADNVLNLTIGGESFEGLMMPEHVATRMTKFAIAQQNRSAGRKPAWVGGGKS